MILADKIISLRKKAGWSQEELAAQLNVSRQSVSKWEGAQSVPDMERILQMSRLFGVSTDFLLKDELEAPETAPLPDRTDSPLRRVSMEEAAAYLALSWQNAPRIALATLLCILSPMALLLLGGVSRLPDAPLREEAAIGVGIAVLLGMVAVGAGLFIACDAKMEDFRFLEGLPGRKLFLKGNHDFWWTTRKKTEAFLESQGLGSLSMLHNNAVEADGAALCGSRGWMFEGTGGCDPKVIAREAGRIRCSLEAAPPGLPKILFLHYPPIYGAQLIPEFFEAMEEFGVRECFYGHIHGPGAAGAFQGEYRGVQLRLISADFLRFSPLKIR